MLQTYGNMLTQKTPGPGRHSSSGTPLLFKVRVLKASTKNAGLTPLTSPHGHSNLKATATWRASAKANR